MTVRKVNLYSLCVLALLPIFLLVAFLVRHDADWGFLLVLVIIVIALWGIGIFLGIGLSVIVRRPAVEPYLYLATQVAVLSTIVIFIINGMHAIHDDRPRLDNVEDNHSFVDLDKLTYEAYPVDYVRTAFLKLESGSGDPNSFHLEKYSCRWKDTVVNTLPDTIHYVYFMYLKNKNVLFAKITVLGDSAAVNLMDSKRRPDQDTLRTKAGVWGRRANLDEVKKRLQDLPDSTRNKLLDIMSQ